MPTSPPRSRRSPISASACAGGCRPSSCRPGTAGPWTCRPRRSIAESRRLRRHDQHGAQAQGRLQAEETRAGASGLRGTRPAGRTPRSSRSRKTRAPRPGRCTPSRARRRAAPAYSRCCTAPVGCSSRRHALGEGRRERGGGARGVRKGAMPPLS